METQSNLDFSQIPLSALSQKSRQILSHLNSTKIFLTETGFFRDFRGVAFAAGVYGNNGANNVINRAQNQIEKIIEIWTSGTFSKLIEILGEIDRFDILDDIETQLVQDAKDFYSKPSKNLDIIPSSISCIDKELLTQDDVRRTDQGLSVQQYDAFLLYADEDTKYALDMLKRLESKGFQLCLKDRDLLGGISFEHDAISKLIEERCHRVIVILTSAFLRSPANTFLINYTQALQIQQRQRKIIPCLYEKTMIIPRTLRIYFLLKCIPDDTDETVSNPLYNFWEKLSVSIRNVPDPTETSLSVTSSEFESKKDNQVHTTKRALIASPDDDKMLQSAQQVSSSFIDVPSKIPRNKTSNKSNDYSDSNQGNECSLKTTTTTTPTTNDLSSPISNISSNSGSSSTSKKGKKWLKTWHKNTNTWLKKRLSLS